MHVIFRDISTAKVAAMRAATLAGICRSVPDCAEHVMWVRRSAAPSWISMW